MRILDLVILALSQSLINQVISSNGSLTLTSRSFLSLNPLLIRSLVQTFQIEKDFNDDKGLNPLLIRSLVQTSYM